MTAPADCLLIGKWRITETDQWDSDYLDFAGPAYVAFKKNGDGEIAFGALQAGLDLEYSRRLVFFTWAGFDDMEEANGTGNAELNDDDTISIEFAYHLGDELEFKARRW